MKTFKILYYVSTGLLTFLMLFSVGNYFFNYDMVAGLFKEFGYPTYIIYPLAIAKLLGLYAIWFSKCTPLREWAYAGFFFNVLLAFFAHYMISDGEQLVAVMAFVFVSISYVSLYKMNKENE